MKKFKASYSLSDLFLDVFKIFITFGFWVFDKVITGFIYYKVFKLLGGF